MSDYEVTAAMGVFVAGAVLAAIAFYCWHYMGGRGD